MRFLLCIVMIICDFFATLFILIGRTFETLLTSQKLIDIINICINSSFTAVFFYMFVFQEFLEKTGK